MSKKYSTTTTLIIVESPAKCKKIEEYLGPGYKCNRILWPFTKYK